MKEFLFPVEYNTHWDEEMIQEWIDSKLPLLSFAFNRFLPHGLPDEPFWLYLYYTKSSSKEPLYQGKLRFRFHVIDWSENKFSRSDIYTYPTTLDGKVWFLCQKYEEVSRLSGEKLAYEDFRHPEGKTLGSCLRSSIAPAICIQQIKVNKFYP
jgi:hypothetical protein